MCSVLLNRPRVYAEIYNDLNGRIANFWRQVIEGDPDLGRRMHYTPTSRDIYVDSLGKLDAGTDLERAYHFWVVVSQSVIHSDCTNRGGWAPGWLKSRSNPWAGDVEVRLTQLRNRMIRVTIESRDAVELILDSYTRRSEDLVIYVDPPYKSVGNMYVARCDFDALEDALMKKPENCRIAISGYEDEWDGLGWHRHDRQDFSPVFKGSDTHMRYRTEVVWTSYETHDLPLFNHPAL